METVEETRRIRLRMLVDELDGLANLVEKLGLARKETSGLSRIMNANVRHERGTTYDMGSPLARTIEEKTGKKRGWMDTPPDYLELHKNERIAQVMRTMELMDEWQQERAIRIIDTLAQNPPAPPQELTAPAAPTTQDQAAKAIEQMREKSKKKKAPRRRPGNKPPQQKGGDNVA